MHVYTGVRRIVVGYNEINFLGDNRHVLVDAVDVEGLLLGFKMVFRLFILRQVGYISPITRAGICINIPLWQYFRLMNSLADR